MSAAEIIALFTESARARDEASAQRDSGQPVDTLRLHTSAQQTGPFVGTSVEAQVPLTAPLLVGVGTLGVGIGAMHTHAGRDSLPHGDRAVDKPAVHDCGQCSRCGDCVHESDGTLSLQAYLATAAPPPPLLPPRAASLDAPRDCCAPLLALLPPPPPPPPPPFLPQQQGDTAGGSAALAPLDTLLNLNRERDREHDREREFEQERQRAAEIARFHDIMRVLRREAAQLRGERRQLDGGQNGEPLDLRLAAVAGGYLDPAEHLQFDRRPHMTQHHQQQQQQGQQEQPQMYPHMQLPQHDAQLQHGQLVGDHLHRVHLQHAHALDEQEHAAQLLRERNVQLVHNSNNKNEIANSTSNAAASANVPADVTNAAHVLAKASALPPAISAYYGVRDPVYSTMNSGIRETMRDAVRDVEEDSAGRSDAAVAVWSAREGTPWTHHESTFAT